MFNNMLMGAAGQSLSGSGGFAVNNSAVFNDDDSEYLTRTPSGASNTKTWTVAFWWKQTKITTGSVKDTLFAARSASPYLLCQTNDNSPIASLFFAQYNGSGYDFQFVTDMIFRDPHAWYHIVIAVDTTQATDTNRVKIYVNGSQVTFGTASYPSQNLDTYWNTTYEQRLGADFGSRPIDGYFSEWVSVDGSQLGPTSFGETDDNGVWRPIDVSSSLSTNATKLLVDRTSGTAIGDMTDSTAGNNLAAAFDGTFGGNDGANNASKRGSVANAFIGKNWGTGVSKTITGFSTRDVGNAGYFNNTSEGRFFLYGSNSTPSAYNDGTLLYSGAAFNSTTAALSKDFLDTENFDTSTAFQYHWIALVPTSTASDVRMAELIFYEDGGSFGNNGYYLPFTSSTLLGEDYGNGSGLVDRTSGTLTGDFTQNGGNAAAFDGNYAQASGSAARKGGGTSTAFLMKDHGSGVTKTITGFRVFGCTDQGFHSDNDSDTVAVKLQGSANGTDFTDLGTLSFTDPGNASPQGKFTGITTSTAYRYHKLLFTFDTATGGKLVGEAELYEGSTPSGGNNFTAVNSPTQTTDTCTDNHATFSPLLSNASKVTLSEGNMRGASSTSSGHVGLIVSGFELPTAGKYYWEWVVNTVGTTPALGWRSIENLNPNGHSSGGNNQADFITGNDYNTGDGRILSSTIDGSTSLSQAAYGNFLTVSGGNPLANGTVLGCAYDADNGLAWFSYNDSWVDGNGTDNSATVKGEIEAGTSGSQAFTTANGAVGEAGLHIIARSNSVSSFNYTLRTRSDQWTGTCPTGFTAVSTKNQAAAVTYAIEDGSTSFQTTLYTGNGASSHEINQSGETSTFAPDFLWTKGRTLTEHRITDIIRGATKVFFTDSSLGNSASTTETTSVLSLDSDGFTVGSGGGVNGSGQAKLAWQWKAGDSNTTVSASGSGDGAINACTHRANQTAGFSLVKYEGANSQISNGQDTKVTHGLGAKPELALIKNMDDTHDWMVLSTSTTGFASDSQTGDDAHLHLNTDDNINGSLFTGHFETGSDSTHFEVGNDNGVNKNGDNYMAYLFRSIPGYTKVGSYTGGTNSTNGVYVDLGFSPAWLMLKNYKNSGESWYVFDNQRPGYNDENNQLIPNSTAAEGAGNILDLLSNGFKIRANDRAYGGSSSSDGYLYLAFAENPFAGTTPATAR